MSCGTFDSHSRTNPNTKHRAHQDRTVMKLAESILMELDQEAQTTKRVLYRIPDDKLT